MHSPLGNSHNKAASWLHRLSKCALSKCAAWACLLAALVGSLPGCTGWGIPYGFSFSDHVVETPATIGLIENPAHIPASDPHMLWEHLVDVVDDYFKIAHEERVRYVADEVVEGRIETFPVTGATQLEPWRKDSVTMCDRLEATFQSIRRIAHIRVSPVEGGFLVDVQVHKELEDVIAPEKSPSGIKNLRNDDSLVRRQRELNVPRDTLGWIPQGRDLALENEILSKLYARLSHL